MKIITAAFLLISCISAASALSLRVHPGDFVYIAEEAPERNLYSAVIQNIAVLNDGKSECNLSSVEIQAERGGVPIVIVRVPAEEIVSFAQKTSALSQQGVLKAYDFYFQTSRYLPEDVQFASSANLKPGQAILISSRSILLPGNAEEVRVTAKCLPQSNPDEITSILLKVRKHQSPNSYHFPLSGTTYVGAGASLQSHHRWVTNEEFALDLAGLGANGKTHTGDGTKLAQYASYGKEVLAVSDGVVVEARGNVTESDNNLRQPGETMEAYDQRILAQQNELLAKGYKEPLGNYVILKHENGEYSHYAHLKAGSVRVKAGETVKRGHAIGQLGHSGNSTEPHLHFQLTDAPDPMYSRGIPVIFENVEVEILGNGKRHLHTGWLVTTK